MTYGSANYNPNINYQQGPNSFQQPYGVQNQQVPYPGNPQQNQKQGPQYQPSPFEQGQRGISNQQQAFYGNQYPQQPNQQYQALLGQAPNVQNQWYSNPANQQQGQYGVPQQNQHYQFGQYGQF